MDKFFENNILVIDEKVQALKFENEYKVYNAEGNAVGTVNEVMSAGRKLMSLFVSKKNMPLNLEIRNNDGKAVASFSRGWTLFMSKIKIFDETGTQIGSIKQKFGLKAKLEVYDMTNKLIASILGSWTAWDFNITDAEGKQLGSVSKKFTGWAREIFTDADKYVINIEPTVSNPAQRIAIAATASVIDLIFKERG